jgi:hypothetical protein
MPGDENKEIKSHLIDESTQLIKIFCQTENEFPQKTELKIPQFE